MNRKLFSIFTSKHQGLSLFRRTFSAYTKSTGFFTTDFKEKKKEEYWFKELEKIQLENLYKTFKKIKKNDIKKNDINKNDNK